MLERGLKKGGKTEEERLVSWRLLALYMTVHVIGPPLPCRTSGLDMTVHVMGPPLP